MLCFRKLIAEALVWYHYYNEEDKESPRRSPRLTKKCLANCFPATQMGQEIFRDRGCGSGSSHLQSTCAYWKIMTWTCCVWSMGMLRCADCCLHHSIEAALSLSSPD